MSVFFKTIINAILNLMAVMPRLIRHFRQYKQILNQVQDDISFEMPNQVRHDKKKVQDDRGFYFFSKLAVFFMLLVSSLSFPFYAQADSPGHVEIISSTTHLGQSNSILMGVKVSLDTGWHIYAPQQDSSFSPPRIENTGSTNITTLQLLWPKVKEKEQYGIKALVYEGKQVFPLIISVKSSQQEARLNAKFSFVGCHKGQCIPFTIPLSYVLSPGALSHTIDAKSLEAALQESSYEPQREPLECSSLQRVCTAGMIILFAFLGGFLLNFMPCVLPVLSLKVFSLLKKKTSLDSIEKSSIRGRFLMSFFGILSFFMAFSFLTIVMKAFGHTLGWGVHFQQPIFLLIMITILGIFGFNLWGFFEIRLPSWLLGWMGDINTRLHEARNSYIKDFFSGLLTALLATPCTAPFLGIAVGASLAYSYTGIFLVFMMIGVGLGFPYLILATFPRVLQILPKPGAWMEMLKKILAMGLWATALWLVYVLATPLMRESKEEAWHVFDEDKISKLVHEGTPVLVNITASWCLTCKANDFFVFKNAKVQEILKEKGVYLMQGDWTRPDPLIQGFLKEYHRAGIPFTLYYSSTYPTGKVLPELLTPTIIEEILKE